MIDDGAHHRSGLDEAFKDDVAVPGLHEVDRDPHRLFVGRGLDDAELLEAVVLGQQHVDLVLVADERRLHVVALVDIDHGFDDVVLVSADRRHFLIAGYRIGIQQLDEVFVH